MTKSQVKVICVDDLKKLYDTQPHLCIIDVREQHEWDDMHIPRAMHIPKDEILSQIPDKIPQRDTALYIHCRGGTRSLTAAHCLYETGYENVYSVEGGIMEWADRGYPIERQNKNL